MVFRRLPLSLSSRAVMAGVLATWCAASAAQAQTSSVPGARQATRKAERIKMSVAPTEAEMQKKVASLPSMDAQMPTKTKALPAPPPVPRSSLLSSSVVLSDGEAFTLVPVGSVLHMPPALRNHVIAKPEGTFLLWPTFLERNAAWLTAQEVPLKMAKGDAKAGEGIMRAVSKDARMVISVYKTGPISILEPVPGTEQPKETASISAEAEQSNSPRSNKRRNP